ncbi:hypothetical protein CKO40_15975 [Halochromatium glycolicum]|uniref:DUF3299 domain-containing protein n=1 Tax=Halochromatium glycolicum TaxID=85075 RepID=A0AAJ0U668_9GAMM|nr:hypothetical protein [Halochromatium glycolicum]
MRRFATHPSGRSRTRGSGSFPALLLLSLLIGGCSEPTDPAADRSAFGERKQAATDAESGAAHKEAETLDWNDLIPTDWQPERLLSEYDVESLSDDDPRALELMDRLRALWDEAPIVAELDDRQIRLPGFVVPLTMDASAITEFLLVPYFGACVHVPPPPRNQIVLVTTKPGRPYPGGMFDTVWVAGQMRVEPFRSDLGDAGYRIEEAFVTPYSD